MKHHTFILLILCFLASASSTRAQTETFEELFKSAFECSDCSDTERIKRFTSAIDYGTSDQRDFKNFTNALINRGTLYMETGAYSKAISDFKRALAIDPLETNVLQKLGTAHLQTGEYAKAIAQYDEYIAVVENQKQQVLMEFPFQNDSTTEISANNFNREMRENSIQELNTKLARAYNNRGIGKAHRDNRSDACTDFRKAYKYGMVELKGFIEQACE